MTFVQHALGSVCEVRAYVFDRVLERDLKFFQGKDGYRPATFPIRLRQYSKHRRFHSFWASGEGKSFQCDLVFAKMGIKFHTGVTRYYCPSTEVSKRASLDSLDPSQICIFGLPVRPSFCGALLSKDCLREELEIDHKLLAVLLMGGGEGMGPIKETAITRGEAM